jgi:hypothetical protein
MYVRQTTRRYKDKTYTNYLLVESIHTPTGPRQKVICSLGDLSPRPAEDWLRLARKVEDALVGQANLFSNPDPEVEQIVRQIQTRQAGTPQPQPPSGPLPEPGPADLISVHTDSIAITQPRSAGPLHVGFQFWKRLGFDAILQRHGFSTRAIQLTCAMTLNRLIHPDSEHAMPRWIRSTALADLLGVDFTTLVDDPLYRNLDRLHPNRAAIESDLVERERLLFQLDPTVYLYDLTSTYFEGQAAQNPKARRGYSRDHRPDCQQVVVGLVIGREGFPLAHEIFAGNTQDRRTLGRMLDLLNADFRGPKVGDSFTFVRVPPGTRRPPASSPARGSAGIHDPGRLRAGSDYENACRSEQRSGRFGSRRPLRSPRSCGTRASA